MSTASGDASAVERVALPAREPATFMTQADALMRKNLTYQKRNVKTNLCLILYPLLLCILLFVIQEAVNHELDKPSYRCGCKCVENTGNGSCKKVCGLQYSDLDQASYCAIQSPPEWPAFLQVPGSQYRAVNYGSSEYADLPESSCLNSGSCPVTFLYTGQNKSLAEALSSNLITDALPTSYSNALEVFSVLIPGTDTYTEYQNYIEPAVLSSTPIYVLRPSCSGNSANLNLTDSFTGAGLTFSVGYQCVEGRSLWRDNSSIINRELYAGYYDGNSGKKIDEYVAAYDFMNSNAKNFNVTIFYNATFQNESAFDPPALLRIPRSINLISQAFLSLWKGSNVRMPLQFTKEMPKSETRESFDFSSVLGPLFFLWVILLLFPVILKSLVYEKENKLRIMMKMHGLGDGPYWLITYAYFLMISVLYMLCFVIFGSVIGLKFFTLNDYGIQAILYFVYLNLQIAVGFLAALVFKRTKTATIVGYKYVFGFGLLSAFLFQYLMEDKNFSRVWVRLMELLPGFSLYRGLYEFGEYSYTADNQGTEGMRWKNLNDEDNGMKEVWIIMVVEWIIILPLAYYLDQVVSTGSGIRKNPLFFLPWKKAGELKSFRKKSLKRSGIIVAVEMEQADVAEERVKVEKILQELDQLQAIVCNDLQKVYPSQDGNAPKYAVHGLTLAVPRGECFGLLGPNGAGKTTSISMITGLLPPTSGTAYIEGLDILKDMDKIYARMGVCPQHDLIWETLTGREHLLFYGRLKNLKGETLHRAVNESLRSVDLYNGGVGDKASGKYSGGMKRRLSVAISLIGDPKVVYMDEPSTGLDPASRNKLWKVVKQAKKDRAIILTTHSMEEAEVLCDRIGIFVDGRLQCIGSCEELKTRYGGSYILTITTSAGEEPVMGQLVQELCPDARVVYSLSGTQKFELAKAHVKIADVFRMIANAKALVTIHAWGVADTTLEEVFVNVARASFASNSHT